MSKDWIPFIILVGIILLWGFTAGREKVDDKELIQFYARRKK